jgi:hypothetical protein
MMERADFHAHIGTENLLPSVEAALERARALLSGTFHPEPDRDPERSRKLQA